MSPGASLRLPLCVIWPSGEAHSETHSAQGPASAGGAAGNTDTGPWPGETWSSTGHSTPCFFTAQGAGLFLTVYADRHLDVRVICEPEPTVPQVVAP